MPTFDEEKFDQLVLFIVHATAGDPNFGRTKLAKVLFYSDFETYRDEGESITGATYIRMPFGPFPEQLSASEARLEYAGRAMPLYDVPDGVEKKLLPLKTSEAFDLYDDWQLEVVKIQIRQLLPETSRSVSDDSHEHPGWILARETGQEIPYSSAYAPSQDPPDEAVELGRRLAHEHQWT